MEFVKGLWRILVAVKDFLVLLFLLLFFGLIYSVLSYSPKAPVAGSGALVLKLDGVIAEQPQQQAGLAQLVQGVAVREFRLRDIVAALDAASRDGNVKAIVLDLDGFLGGGQVALSRVGVVLEAAKRAGKPVFAFATAYSDDGYQLAAHASEIWANPIGGVMLTGPGGSQLYYKGLIDRLGVNAHIYRVGSYKSFVEPYTRTDQSDEARDASTALAKAVWSNWQAEVQRARPKAKLAAYIGDPAGLVAAARGDIAQAGVDAGLIDRLGGAAAFGARVAEVAGPNAAKSPGGYARIPFALYSRLHPAPNTGEIGVVTIAGEIVDGEAAPGTAGGATIARLIHAAVARGNLKALVVRVDSPGGSVLASEQIRGAILSASTKGLPIVVSMANVAASGGYWVATPAKLIFAEPATITGSIGVFGIVPTFEGTLAKAGITTDGIRTTPLSGEPDLLGGVGPAFDAIAQMGVEDVYRRFVDLVARSRRLPVTRVDEIAQGRVWDGGTARQLGLVDRFGGLEDAVAAAATLAGQDPAKARPFYLEDQADPLTRWLTAYFDRPDEEEDTSAQAANDWLGQQGTIRRLALLQAVEDVRGLIGGGAIRASCLECRAMMPLRPVRPPSAGERSLWAMLTGLL